MLIEGTIVVILIRDQIKIQNQDENDIPITEFFSTFTIRKYGAHKKQITRQIKKNFFSGKETKNLVFIISKKKIAKIAENISFHGEISNTFINHFLALQNKDI
jgi:type IV secretory pathway ATPase VirB11/archaellum biosynthesis ATPase